MKRRCGGRRSVGMVLGALLIVGVASAADTPDLARAPARLGYSVGFQVGGDFRREQLELDPQAVVEGVTDALAGRTPRYDLEKMRETLRELGSRAGAPEAAPLPAPSPGES